MNKASLDRLSRQFETKEPGEILRWAVGAVPAGRLVLSTSFGVGGILLIHLLREEDLRVPVVFVDTLHHSDDLPYNPLHDQGYASIGDRPLTTPVAPGEAERAGRWRGSSRTECGLHRS